MTKRKRKKINQRKINQKKGLLRIVRISLLPLIIQAMLLVRNILKTCPNKENNKIDIY